MFTYAMKTGLFRQPDPPFDYRRSPHPQFGNNTEFNHVPMGTNGIIEQHSFSTLLPDSFHFTGKPTKPAKKGGNVKSITRKSTKPQAKKDGEEKSNVTTRSQRSKIARELEEAFERAKGLRYSNRLLEKVLGQQKGVPPSDIDWSEL